MDWVCANCGTKELIGGEFVCGKSLMFEPICKACLIQTRPERSKREDNDFEPNSFVKDSSYR